MRRGFVIGMALLLSGLGISIPSSVSAAPGAPYKLPYPAGSSYTITQTPGSGFSHADDYNRHAVDFGMPTGTPIVASASGTIYFEGWTTGGGIQVLIDHGNNRCSQYAHLNASIVDAGNRVTQGQLIGYSGATGNVTGPHLHWNIVYCNSHLSREIPNTVERGTSYPTGLAPVSQNSRRSTPAAGNVSVYGVRDDGRITYSLIHAPTGDRKTTTVSSASLDFTPKTMATLNFNTLIIAATTGQLYRVDIGSVKSTVTFTTTKIADKGWAYDHLAYDGYGHLFGISNGKLRRWNVTVGKHSFQLGSSGVVDTGFVLKSFTTAGNNWILGTTSDGRLLSYRISAGYDWTGYTLESSGWSGVRNLLSPGGGAYYGRYADGSMYHYYDVSPYDGSGADIIYHLNDPVDTRGWTQVVLSAQPRTVS